MKKLALITLLLLSIAHSATAAEPPEPISAKKKSKLGAYMDKVGINNPEILALVGHMTDRMEDGHLRLSEERFEHGRAVLMFKMEPRVTSKQIILKYQPDDSNFLYTATPKSVMVNYGWKF